jgi:hypothetical protein
MRSCRLCWDQGRRLSRGQGRIRSRGFDEIAVGVVRGAGRWSWGGRYAAGADGGVFRGRGAAGSSGAGQEIGLLPCNC